MAAGTSATLVVGLTGALSDLGRLLLPRLLADAQVREVVVFDLAPPSPLPERVRFVPLDLLKPDAQGLLEAAVKAFPLDALYHLAFINSRVHQGSFAHELEVLGTMNVLNAVAAHGVRRLIVPSLTALYGARPSSPTFARESQPLGGVFGVRFITDRVEVERQLVEFAGRVSHTEVLTLRFAPIVGPTSNNPFTRLARRGVVPTALGFDPLWQLVHEDDAARALHLGLHTRSRGIFNIVGEGVAPISSILRSAGARPLPLPAPVLRRALRAFELTGAPLTPLALMDFFRFSWLADGQRAARALHFVAHVPVHQAAKTMAQTRRVG